MRSGKDSFQWNKTQSLETSLHTYEDLAITELEMTLNGKDVDVTIIGLEQIVIHVENYESSLAQETDPRD
jgi:light-regulated signal transduction histidine kinase (bacteriophytochrome)